ncbi:hypothetical protein ACOSQ4_014898 [Xanthoceras sorbifolium]
MENLPGNLLPDEASPAWLNKGDNTWQLTVATLVGLQSIPGLAFMAIYAFAMVIVCWVGWDFRMSFGDKLVVFLGKPGVALDEKFLLGQAFLGYFRTATMVFFQGVFACITLVLIAGALLGRMNFRAWVMFLAKLGVIDFAGGYVIHVSAGVAGFTASYWVGSRTDKDREITQPNNIIMMLAGVGLLWMGWSGFNGRAPFAVSSDTSLAVLNTHITRFYMSDAELSPTLIPKFPELSN